MKLTVLVDNNAQGLCGEWGLSFLIEEGDKKILFDVGESDLFLHNALRLKEDLLDLDYLVFSHGHHDHTRGLQPLIDYYNKHELAVPQRPGVVAHPEAFCSRKRSNGIEMGPLVTEAELKENFSVNLNSEPVWLTEKLVFLGEIARNNHFEGQDFFPGIETAQGIIDDYVIDDTGLAYMSPAGLVVIVGCSHSGICNIVEQAKEICGEERIFDIVGGFHLIKPRTEVLEETCKYLKDLQPEVLHTCHCTDLKSKIALAGVTNLEEIGTGSVLEYE